MKTNIMKLALAIAVVLFLGTTVFAAEVPVSVSASVPQLSGILEVAVSSIDPGADKVSPTDDVWTPVQGTSVDFGTLDRDATNKIFTAAKFFAVDVSVLDNTGAGWVLTHTTTPVQFGTETLDDSIVVSFSKVTKDRVTKKDTDTPLGTAMGYKASNNAQFTRAELAAGQGGWLRIYYGIATGNDDPTKGSVTPAGVFAIPQYQLAGTYSGGVTITLTPQ